MNRFAQQWLGAPASPHQLDQPDERSSDTLVPCRQRTALDCQRLAVPVGACAEPV